MANVVSGEVHGLQWFEMPRVRAGIRRSDYDHNDVDTVTILCLPGEVPSEQVMDQYLDPQKHFADQFRSRIGFRPFDEADVLPGRLVAYRRNWNAKKLNEWLQEYLDIPDSIDVTFEHEREYSSTAEPVLVATARTMQKGRIVSVRKALDRTLPIRKAVQPVFAYFEKNCPKPSSEQPRHTIAAHIAALLEHIDQSGRRMLEEWLGDDHQTLMLPGNVLPGAGVEKLDLRITSYSNAIAAEIKLNAGPIIKDDRTGVAITMDGSLPLTVLSGLKGEKLSRVIDVSWVQHITVRSATSDSQNDKIMLRGDTSEYVPLALPGGHTLSEDRAIEQIRELAGAYHEIDEAVATVLMRLPLPDVAAILSAVKQSDYYNFGVHGLPGWTVRRSGNYIKIEGSPAKSYDEFIADILPEPSAV